MKKLILTIVLGFAALTFSQQVTNTINFTADLSAIIGSGPGFFDPTTDSIQVMGLDWDGLGTIVSGQRKMTQQGTTSIFTTSIQVQSGTGLGAGDSTKWKFKAYPDVKFVNGGWENRDDRWVVYQTNGSTINLPTIEPVIEPVQGTGITNTINFIADISGILGLGAGGAFDPNQDSLQVMGLDWNGGSNVVGNRRMFNTDPFNPGIYTTSLTVDATDDSTTWKFKAFPDARFSNGGWESGADRYYVYGPNGTTATVGPIVPRIDPLFDPIANDVNITFNVDMTGAVNRYNGQPIPLNELEFVGMRGGGDFLGSWANGGNWTPNDTGIVVNGYPLMLVLTDQGSNIWSITTTALAGTPGGAYEYKFAAMYPGADTVNGGSSPLDNEGGFGQNHKFILVDNASGLEFNNVFGDFTTGVKLLDDLVPDVYELAQNYPNPFNPTTTIRYSIPEAGLVNIKVFNLLGQEVAELVNTQQNSGNYEVIFDATQLASGIYFYTIEASKFTQTKKMLLLK